MEKLANARNTDADRLNFIEHTMREGIWEETGAFRCWYDREKQMFWLRKKSAYTLREVIDAAMEG